MNLFSYVKSRLSILDVIGEYTKLKKAGGYWKAHCPFHHEKTASFTVSPHREIFYCFGCHIGGDLISFVATAENCTQLEAAQHLIEQYQIEIPAELLQTTPQDPDERNRYFQLCELVSRWCHEQLKKSPAALRYLHERNFNDQCIQTFLLGYFPGGLKSMKAFTGFMRTKSVLVTDLIDAHIVAQGKNVLYSPFEERIIFPIKDHLGRFCGFGGRVFKPHDKRAKYYNSHENNYFNKGSLLFGFDLAKKTIQKKEELFLVEGYTDCIAMVEHGFDNTVATLGTSCTLEHLKTLSRYAHQLYTVYDGDKAGKKAIMRLTELCWKVNLELKVICLPDGEDPATFLEKDGNLKQLADNAQEIFTFFVDALGQEFADKPLSKKLQTVSKLIEIIANVHEPLKRDLLLKNGAKILDIPFESLRAELEKKNKKGPKRAIHSAQTQKEPPAQNNSERSDNALEKRLLFAILNNMSLFSESNEDYLITCLPAPLSSVLQKLKMLKEQPTVGSPDLPHLFNRLDQEEKQAVSKILLQIDQEITPSSFDQLLKQFQRKTWKAVVRNVKLKLERAEQKNDTQEIEKILHSFANLKKKLLGQNSGPKKP